MFLSTTVLTMFASMQFSLRGQRAIDIKQRIVMSPLGSTVLLKHEWDALKDALKRDIDREMKMAQVTTDFLHWHLYNARMGQRLLDIMHSEEG